MIEKKIRWWGNLCALLAIIVLTGIQLYHVDVTIHGPDQIRDMEVARQLVQQGVWPTSGPPMFGERIRLTPFFYWLLALPLWLYDSDISVFIAFGLLFFLSTVYLWKQVSDVLGWRCGLVYVLLAFPLFPCLYAHSAWSPGLVMTFSNVLLGLYLRHFKNPQKGLFALPWVFFLLLQIHPSVAPLLLGFTIYALRRPKFFWNRNFGISLLTIFVACILWLLLQPSAEISPQASIATHSYHHWLKNLLDTDKWIFAIKLPLLLTLGITHDTKIIPLLISFSCALLPSGWIWCAFYLRQNRAIYWIIITVFLWLIISMAFLNTTGFWHFDVIYPWLAVASAWGIGWCCYQAKKECTLTFYVVLGLLFFILLSAHLLFYRLLEREGKIDLRHDAAIYPKGFTSNIWIPLYSYRQAFQLRNYLLQKNICRQQLGGIEPMLMAESTLRYFENHCSTPDAGHPYFAARSNDSEIFQFTQGLPAIAEIGKISIYAPEHLPISINGVQQTNFFTQDKVNYMTYLPMYFPDGWKIMLSMKGHNSILRVGLRCSEEYPMGEDAFWNIYGAETLSPLRFTKNRFLSLVYYDIEWILKSKQEAAQVEIHSPSIPIHCDISVIARPSHAAFP